MYKKRIDKIANYIILVLVAAYCILAEILPVTVFCMIGAVIIGYIAATKGGIKFDFGLMALMLGLVLNIYYGFYFLGNASTVDVNKMLSPIVAYILGLVLVRLFGDSHLSVKRVYFTMAFVMAAYGIVCSIYCVINNREGTYLGNVVDNPELMNRRLIEVLFFCLTAAFLWSVITFKENRVLSVAIIIVNIFAQLLCIRIHTRYNTYVLIIELIVLLGICLYRMLIKKCSTVITTIVSIIVPILVCLLLGFMYKKDILGIATVYSNSYWGADGGIFHSYKYENMREAIRSLADNRKGFFIAANDVNTSFNMWLDYARDYGIYSLSCLLLFKLITIYYTVRLLFDKNVGKIKYLLVFAYIAFNIFYSTDSVAKTQIYVWNYGLIICGMIRGLQTNNKRI